MFCLDQYQVARTARVSVERARTLHTTNRGAVRPSVCIIIEVKFDGPVIHAPHHDVIRYGAGREMNEDSKLQEGVAAVMHILS
ncbi:hypothetical protein O3G_MSEX002530 [Manduca sexta]|uniref:Uncharacterized protein n=1 Tax=Manduca sexta TaxID=7130 RepID=A0A921YP07_MANSE|nr:hypothetical protein O3G_MSEX002530 [Manduca sexta]